MAKNLSLSIKIAVVAKQNNVSCFCADFTVNPILIVWKKNVAARLVPFPGLGTGLLETNGHLNYRDWKKTESYHPFADTPWRCVKGGSCGFNNDFYLKVAGCFISPGIRSQCFKAI